MPDSDDIELDASQPDDEQSPTARAHAEFVSARTATDRAETAIFRNPRKDNRSHPYESALAIEEVVFETADIPAPWQVNGDTLEFCNLAAELSTKNMTVQERAQFMKAKMSELESFFENGVWTADFTGKPDPKRTLKGRFLLK